MAEDTLPLPPPSDLPPPQEADTPPLPEVASEEPDPSEASEDSREATPRPLPLSEVPPREATLREDPPSEALPREVTPELPSEATATLAASRSSDRKKSRINSRSTALQLGDSLCSIYDGLLKIKSSYIFFGPSLVLNACHESESTEWERLRTPPYA